MAVADSDLHRDGRITTRAATVGALLALAVVTVHLVGVRSFTHETWPGAAPEIDLPIWANALAGACLLLGVAAAWSCRSTRPGVALGLAAAAAGAALPVWGSWTGAPATLRAAVLAAPALVAGGLAQVVPRWGSNRSRIGALAGVLAAAAAAVHLLAYDPFADLQCSRVCRSIGGPWVEGRSPAAIVAVEGLLVLAAVTVGLTGVALGHTVSATVRAAAGVSLLVVGAAAVAEISWRDSEVWARTTSVWLPWALGPTAGVVCVLAALAARTRRAIDSLLSDLEGGPTDRLHFAVPGESRWVDAAGEDVPLETSPAVVLLYDEYGPAVRLAGANADPATSGLTPSRRLALSNARLTALAAARVDHVQAAQRRAVQRSDDERRRIERDLHDGAQQTLVSAAFHLSASATRHRNNRAIEEAQAQVTAALAALRDLVHGPVPAVLLEEGLHAALQDLALETPSPVTVAFHGDEAQPPEVAVTAYLCVTALIRRASPQPCHVDLEISDAGVRLVVRGNRDLADPVDQAVLDRVGALGGSVSLTRENEQSSAEVWLPCES